MKRLSLQWRITLMTALLICSTCVLMNCLVGYSGMRYMDSIGNELSAHSKVEAASPTGARRVARAISGSTARSKSIRRLWSALTAKRCSAACWPTL